MYIPVSVVLTNKTKVRVGTIKISGVVLIFLQSQEIRRQLAEMNFPDVLKCGKWPNSIPLYLSRECSGFSCKFLNIYIFFFTMEIPHYA